MHLLFCNIRSSNVFFKNPVIVFHLAQIVSHVLAENYFWVINVFRSIGPSYEVSNNETYPSLPWLTGTKPWSVKIYFFGGTAIKQIFRTKWTPSFTLSLPFCEIFFWLQLLKNTPTTISSITRCQSRDTGSKPDLVLLSMHFVKWWTIRQRSANIRLNRLRQIFFRTKNYLIWFFCCSSSNIWLNLI